MVYRKTRQAVYVQESYANLGASLLVKFSLQRNNLGNFESTRQAFIMTYSNVLLKLQSFTEGARFLPIKSFTVSADLAKE